FFQPPLRPTPPCGTAASILSRKRLRLSGRSAAVSVVISAIMPQPMSTPTAAGTMAALVAITRRWRRCRRAHRASPPRAYERQRSDVEQLTPRRVLDRHAVDPRLDRRVAGFDRLWACHDRQLWGW